MKKEYRMILKVKNNVYWVGKIDWELRKFHGDEYSTHRGSSYNSYLLKEDKIVLIDTVWKPFAKEFIEKMPMHLTPNQYCDIILGQVIICPRNISNIV
jgi:anaerobic nitric oxide reductase flavorubredoxin